MPERAMSDRGRPADLSEQIVDTAIAIAEEKGRWSAVRLHDVADRLSIPATQVLDHYRNLDAVADAWFRRGLKAMVAPKPADFIKQPEWRRIELCLLAWFDTLSEHRRVSAQMLQGKLHPSHPHHSRAVVHSRRSQAETWPCSTRCFAKLGRRNVIGGFRRPPDRR